MLLSAAISSQTHRESAMIFNFADSPVELESARVGRELDGHDCIPPACAGDGPGPDQLSTANVSVRDRI